MPGLKPSPSLTSMSSVDKDATLNSLMKGYAKRQNALPITDEPNVSTERKKSAILSHRGKSDMMEDAYKPKVLQAHGGIQKRKRKKKPLITANLSGTRYDVVRQMVELHGMVVAKEEDQNCYLIWNDAFISTEKICELKPYQRINHFPGMGEVTRKDNLARNMTKIQKLHPEEYNFVPKSWVLPADYGLLQSYSKDMRAKKKSKTFIVKPSNGAQGHGISLFKNVEKIPSNEHIIVQEYIDKPFLLDGYKFDLRIYVVVTSCDPLRIFMYNDGLVRLSTEKYQLPTESNINHLYMHLTNYSVNKHNEFYEKGTSVATGSKRSIQYLNDYLRRERGDQEVALLWRNIGDMIVKTLLVAEPHVLHGYRMCRPGAPPGSDSVCFEILGFDVILDRKLRPSLLEINRSPSFGTDEKIDYDIKSGLVEDTIRLLNIKLSDKKKNLAAQKAEAQKRLLRPSKRVDMNDASELEKKKLIGERRKTELQTLLTRVERTAAREDYENRNLGRFWRIFPVEDRIRQEKFINLLQDAFSTFLSGRSNNMAKEIEMIYRNRMRKTDILDKLAEFESDEKDGRVPASGRGLRGPKPLTTMPGVSPHERTDDEEEGDDDNDSIDSMQNPLYNRRPRSVGSVHSRPGSSLRGRSASRFEEDDEIDDIGFTRRSGSSAVLQQNDMRAGSVASVGRRSRSLTRIPSSKVKPTPLQKSMTDNVLAVENKGEEEENTKKTLSALNEMRIKFPGKSDHEAELILDKIHENWKFHKPRIASYWLVKLDSIKRRKVVDIVRSNVKAVLQRIWKTSDVDFLKIYRIFTRVFNRLLWSHGQGLWNCFSTTGNSWETIFSKSTENISEPEMNCCRRIVQLCQDCLLIVYQFAAEAKGTVQNNDEQYSSTLNHQQGVAIQVKDVSQSIPANHQPYTLSRRYSKLYGRVDPHGS